tara:strand:+ start:1628 stop:3442 length:1815 start_codon:yes stop_codon:yes gene_type:complete
MIKKIKYLDGKQLYDVISIGIKNLIVHQKTLDEINVFPVPDGDTGTNMVFTLMPILTDLEDTISDQAGIAMSQIANTALESARGNSGTIIAQFYYGLSKSFKNLDRIDVNQFSAGLMHGYNSAIESLTNPEEGTIITVMRDVANQARSMSSEGCVDYIVFIKKIFKEAELSLKATKTILKILKKSDVVDSGALGFVLLIQGVLNVIERGHGGRIQTTHLDISYELEKIESLSKDIDFTIENKFCTECVVRGEHINRTELKSKIKDFGDSMVVAGSKKRVKIHIHTNEPAKLFKMCNVYGQVVDKKVDDMTKQEKSIHEHGSASIAIVADSTADLPEDYLKETQIVPVKYSFGRQQHIDKVTQTVKEYYEQMASDPNHPKTSQPTSRDFIKMYDFISSHYNNIISIHLSKKLSGTYQSALNGSQSAKINNITIIDSETASVGLGLLTMYAVDMKQAGKNYDQIISGIESKKKDTEIYLLLENLRYAVKGGRLPSKVKTIADLFRLTPILTVKKGKLKPAGVLFGKSHTISKFSRFLDKKIESNCHYRMLIAHGNCKQKAQNLEATLNGKFPNIIQNNILELGGGLGSHAGPGALVIGLQKIDEDL